MHFLRAQSALVLSVFAKPYLLIISGQLEKKFTLPWEGLLFEYCQHVLYWQHLSVQAIERRNV